MTAVQDDPPIPLSFGQKLVHAVMGGLFGTIVGAVVGGLFGLLGGYLVMVGILAGAVIGAITGGIRSQTVQIGLMVSRFVAFMLLCGVLALALGGFQSASNPALLYAVCLGSLLLPWASRSLGTAFWKRSRGSWPILCIFALGACGLGASAYVHAQNQERTAIAQQKIQEERQDERERAQKQRLTALLWRMDAPDTLGVLRYPHGTLTHPDDIQIEMPDSETEVARIQTHESVRQVVAFYNALLVPGLHHQGNHYTADFWSATVPWQGVNLGLTIAAAKGGAIVYFSAVDTEASDRLSPEGEAQQAALTQHRVAKIAQFKSHYARWRYPRTLSTNEVGTPERILLVTKDDPRVVAAYYRRCAGFIYPHPVPDCARAWHGRSRLDGRSVFLIIHMDDNEAGCGEKTVIEIL